MINKNIIAATIDYTKETLRGAEGGHDWFHIERVYKNALLIAKDENVDQLIVALGALLHDIADAKFHHGDETLGPRLATEFLKSIDVSQEVIIHVVKIIENISFKSSLENKENRFSSKELDVVQDGIARAFNYGGFKNRELYNPDIQPNLNMTKEEYKKSNAPTINHFHEKLLLLKNKMNTETGKKLANSRHQFMLDYLNQFELEWNGKL